jgi:hypothetical protein
MAGLSIVSVARIDEGSTTLETNRQGSKTWRGARNLVPAPHRFGAYAHEPEFMYVVVDGKRCNGGVTEWPFTRASPFTAPGDWHLDLAYPGKYTRAWPKQIFRKASDAG